MSQHLGSSSAAGDEGVSEVQVESPRPQPETPVDPRRHSVREPAHPPSGRGRLAARAKVEDQLAEGLLRILDQTKGVPKEAKARARGPVESLVREAAPYLRRRLAVHRFDATYLPKLPVALGVPLLVVGLVLQTGEAERTGLVAAPIAGALLVATALVGLVVGLWLVSVLISVFRRFVAQGRVPAFAATAAILILGAGSLASFPGGGWFVATVQRGLWGAGLFFAAFLAIAQSLHLAQVLAVSLAIRKVPEAEVVVNLLLTLHAAETLARAKDTGEQDASPASTPEGEPHRAKHPQLERVEVAGQLHQLATTIERALPLRFSSIHPASERWLREEARSIAAAVDRMSGEVLLGGQKVLVHLASRIGAMLVHVAEGDWASLARADPGAFRPPHRLIPRLRALVSAVVPLLVGLGLRSGILPVEASADVADGLVRFGIAWAALHAFVILDARVTEKIAGTERLMAFLQ